MTASDPVAWGEAQPVCVPALRQLGPFPWGLTELALDEELAAAGKFAVARASGVMPNGTGFAIPAEQPLPPPLEIAPGAAGAIVYLRSDFAYALERGEASIGLARVAETRGWGAAFDERYVPPLLDIAASPALTAQLAALVAGLRRRAGKLAEEPSPGDDALARRLEGLTLARHLPVLQHLATLPAVHPERLFETLAALAGELGLLAAAPPAEVRYDHEDLEGSLVPLFAALAELLAEAPPVRAVMLALEAAGPRAWISPIEDRSLYQYGRFVLALDRAAAPADVPAALRLGAVEKMREIVAGRARGVPLRPLATPPPALRGRPGRCFFELDRASPGWGDFAFATALGLQAMDSRGELAPELWCLTEEQS